MDPNRWRRIEELYEQALGLEASDRPAFLEQNCDRDESLRREVESLLFHHENAGRFLPAPQPANPPQAGESISHYQIEARLGEGAMGVVYGARDNQLHRTVALKILSPRYAADADRRQRLIAEARVASSLNHPNIVSIYEVGSDCGVDFIAMEFIEGRTLKDLIPAVGLPLRTALDYASQIAQGLAKAHDSGIVHRDLKPGNIMVTPAGTVKVLDFGLARRLGPPPEHNSETLDLTSGLIAGTPGYMSPEQLQGQKVDTRTDVYSFGVVLSEMLIGRSPFPGGWTIADFGNRPLPAKLKAFVLKLLEKDPDRRYRSAVELRAPLQALEASLGSGSKRIAVAAAILVVCILGSVFWYHSSRPRWALETAAPEISRLIDAGEYVDAAALARKARAVLPNDPTLEKLWLLATGEMSIDSIPQGADVFMRPYNGDPDAWSALGKTPLLKLRVPRDKWFWKVVKPGFAPEFFIGLPPPLPPPGFHTSFGFTLKLRAAGSVPPEMVVVPGGLVGLNYPLGQVPLTKLSGFLIDRHEVTNEEFKKFVDAGGYQRAEFWKQPFLRDGTAIPVEEALAFFRDSTGHPGSSTWQAGAYPKGRGKYPVGGVSWYEAGAYAQFVGKSLPTAYHWTRASQSNIYAAVIADGGNFTGLDTQPVGNPRALSGFGTTDMAGNVKEWCLNEARDGRRMIMGGGIGEPSYLFYQTDSQPPWERRANFGFRCVRLDSPPAPPELARLEATTRDFTREKPVSDDVFKAYTALYAYDKGDLNSRTEQMGSKNDWSRVKVTFDAAYGQERVTAWLFLPKHALRPWQAVVYFPGAGSLSEEKFDLSGVEDTRGFLVKSGRAVVFPIYKGMYERQDGLKAGGKPPAFFRDHVIEWSKDLGRTLDYLETRHDIDSTKIAYFGDSLGGPEAPILAAVEPRIKAIIVESGGFQLRHDLPEVDPFNFAPHVTIPVLMLSGRYDGNFPLESSQIPLFHSFGTPAKDKKQVVYDGGHGVFPLPNAVRECLDWLDKYLGPVR